MNESIGDLMTHDIWSDATKKVVQRSAVRSADPNRGGFPNLRVSFQDDEDLAESEIVEPSNILDEPGLACPPPQSTPSNRTRKHKVKWHDTNEGTPEVFDEFRDFKDTIEEDFGPKITTDDLPQSHEKRRDELHRSCRKAHLVTAGACLSLDA